jgi:hypothetical protein
MAGLTGLEPATSSVTGWRSDLAELQPRKPETAWWAKQDSNLRPLPCKGSALPTELFARHPERGYYTTSPAGFVKGSGGCSKMGSIFTPVRSDKGTSCRSENAEAARTARIPPHPRREWGDSTCEKPLLRAEQGWLAYTLIRNHAGEAIFRTPSEVLGGDFSNTAPKAPNASSEHGSHGGINSAGRLGGG